MKGLALIPLLPDIQFLEALENRLVAHVTAQFCFNSAAILLRANFARKLVRRERVTSASIHADETPGRLHGWDPPSS